MGHLGYIIRREPISAHGILQLVLKRGQAVEQVRLFLNHSGFLWDSMTFPCHVCPVMRLSAWLRCWQHCVLRLLEL